MYIVYTVPHVHKYAIRMTVIQLITYLVSNREHNAADDIYMYKLQVQENIWVQWIGHVRDWKEAWVCAHH